MECFHCGGIRVIKSGRTRHNKQRFKCQECGRTFRENPQPAGYTEELKEEILRAYHERSSMRALTRIFGVSSQTVSSWLKKSSSA